jgi:hypothetical protein
MMAPGDGRDGSLAGGTAATLFMIQGVETCGNREEGDHVALALLVSSDFA